MVVNAKIDATFDLPMQDNYGQITGTYGHRPGRLPVLLPHVRDSKEFAFDENGFQLAVRLRARAFVVAQPAICGLVGVAWGSRAEGLNLHFATAV